MDNNCAIVSIWSLPRTEVYVDLENHFKETIFAVARQYAGGWDKLGMSLNLPLNKYGKCKIIESSRTKKISLDVVQKLISYLKNCGEEVTEQTVEEKVICIAPRHGAASSQANCILNPHLPFNFNTPAGATVISALLHDGGINSRLLPHYSNPENLQLRIKVCNAFKEVFGDFKSIKSDPFNNIQLYFPKITGIILVHGLGLQYGRKVVNNPSIPNFLHKSDEHLKAAFLQQAFDDEAHVHNTHRTITLKLASASKEPPRLLVDIQKLLKDFNIHTSEPIYNDSYQSKDGVCATRWYLCISHQDNFTKFFDKIGFHTKKKQDRLSAIVHSLKQPHFSVKNKTKIVITSCKKLQMRDGFITSRDLAEELDRSQPLTKIILRQLVQNKVLRIKERKIGNRAAKYVFCDSYE